MDKILCGESDSLEGNASDCLNRPLRSGSLLHRSVTGIAERPCFSKQLCYDPAIRLAACCNPYPAASALHGGI